MAEHEYTFIPDTEHIFPNLTLEKKLRDGELAGYRLTPNEGYVMYRLDANEFEMDEYGNEYPVTYYYVLAYLPVRTNFDAFNWAAVLRSTVDENYIFGIGDKKETI